MFVGGASVWVVFPHWFCWQRRFSVCCAPRFFLLLLCFRLALFSEFGRPPPPTTPPHPPTFYVLGKSELLISRSAIVFHPFPLCSCNRFPPCVRLLRITSPRFSSLSFPCLRFSCSCRFFSCACACCSVFSDFAPFLPLAHSCLFQIFSRLSLFFC